MAIEREHKYLVEDTSYRSAAFESHSIRQGYLSRNPESTVRVRTLDEKGFITIKGITKGDSRLEYEYEIPHSEAIELLKLCSGRIIDKTRYCVRFDDRVWEIDEFHGDLSPLTIAEVELEEDVDEYLIPCFVGEEVTDDPHYYNSAL